MSEVIKPKERDAVVQALRTGVVPRLGLRHVQVGRAREIDEMIKDVDRITDGGSAVRFIIGEYGSGKTFFLNLTRLVAMEKKLVTINADLAPDRRIHATGGQGRNLYAELMRNISTRTKPDGGALASIVERFIGEAQKEATASGQDVEKVIEQRLAPLQELVSGYDFAHVVGLYWTAFQQSDETGKAAALRWLRGEYNLKTEAREALGVRSIIDDDSVYDYLKLMARFVKLAGYDGLLIVLDEMVNLFKLVSAQARNQNYEQILRIVNDVLQGNAEGFGVIFGGTPEFLMDSRRGLYSYEALRSRLAENTFAHEGFVDVSGPVVRLKSLSPEEMFVLLSKLRNLQACGNAEKHLIPDEALHAFMEHCSKRIGEAYFRTPRNTIKAFLDLLAILEQNEQASWQELLKAVHIAEDRTPSNDEEKDGGEDSPADELASFKL